MSKNKAKMTKKPMTMKEFEGSKADKAADKAAMKKINKGAKPK